MAAITSQTFNLPDCPLHYVQAGPADGIPIVLLHGMKFQAQTWQDLGTLDFLAGLGCCVYAVDMPGFGKSGTSSLPPTEVLHRFLAHVQKKSLVLIGPSMGGRIALEYAISHPEQLRGLVVVGAVGVEENRAGLARIKVPSLIIWGGEDQVSPLSNSDILLEELGQASREIYPGAPHPCYLDQTDRWHQSLRSFLIGLGD